mgnify:FL=1
MSPTTLFFLIVFLSICVIGVMKTYGDTPDEWVWATSDLMGTRPVPIYYLEEIPCDVPDALACYDSNTDEIYITKGKGSQWASTGGTIRDHEILHAFGYNHVEMGKLFYFPNPNDNSNLYGLYEIDNSKHWDPVYEHIPFPQDPQCQKHNVNKPANCGVFIER